MRRAVVGAVLVLAISACGGTTQSPADARVPTAAQPSPQLRRRLRASRAVAKPRALPGRVRAARRDGLAEARAGRRPRRPRRPHVDARPVHANRVPVRWPRRLDGVRRHLGVRPRVRHLAGARPGRPGTCGALRARGGLGGRRRPRRVGRPGRPDGLLRRPLGVRPRGKRLVAPPERRAETRRPLRLVFGDRPGRSAVDQPRLHSRTVSGSRTRAPTTSKPAGGPTKPPMAPSPSCAACTRAG